MSSARAVSGCQYTTVVAKKGNDVGLVKRDPLLHAIPKSREAEAGIVVEVGLEFGSVQRAAITLVQLQRKILSKLLASLSHSIADK